MRQQQIANYWIFQILASWKTRKLSLTIMKKDEYDGI